MESLRTKQGKPLAHMEVAVACAAWVAAEGPAVAGLADADTRTFWHASVQRTPAGGTAAGVGGLLAWFDAARVIVAYNGHAFDMQVLRALYDGDDERWQAHCDKLHDPFDAVTRAAGRRVKLDTLLRLNGLAGKSGAGSDAPRWWAEGQLARLEEYCARDVSALGELVLRAQVRVQRGVTTDAMAVRPVVENGARAAATDDEGGDARGAEHAEDAQDPKGPKAPNVFHDHAFLRLRERTRLLVILHR